MARQSDTVDLGLVAVVVMWGLHFAIVKQALFVVNPMAFAVVRFALAAVLLLVLVWLREGSLAIRREDWAAMLLLGAIGGANQVLWFHGLLYTTSGKSALLIAASPAFVALMRAARGERIGWRAALALLSAFVGVGLIVESGGGGEAASTQRLGDLLTMGAAVTWALYANTGPRLLRSYSPLRVTAYVFAITTVMTAVPGLGLALATPWAQLPYAVWGQLMYSAFFGAALGWVLWYSGVSRIGPLNVIIYQYLVPVVAVLVSVLWLNEPLGVRQVVGALLVLAGTLAARMMLRPTVIRKDDVGAVETETE